MVYCSDDPIQARMLEEIGCVAVMPLASLIGSGMGILNPWNLSLIIEQAKVPVLVDAGVGTASDAAIAMELGCDGVLMNTAIAGARDPVRMARAMKLAVQAGREAFLAGRMPQRFAASPSSPMAGRIAGNVAACRRACWCLPGSIPSGGAGIAADIAGHCRAGRACAAGDHGADGAGQQPGLRGVSRSTPAWLRARPQALIDTFDIRAVKIGIPGSARQCGGHRGA